MMELTITQPDDWHIHLRDDAALTLTVPDAARSMARAIVMPNLKPPVVNASQARTYYDRIIAARPQGSTFEPLMTLYLTDRTTPEDIREAAASGIVHAVKLYPAGATTNSDSGVTDIRGRYPVFKAMAETGIKLLIHGEVTTASVDIFDREAAFLDTFLKDIVHDFPDLQVVLEHITTKAAVDFVKAAPANLAATITAHHLLFNRNHMLAGGIRPHYYCLPILKRSTDQTALLEAATSGNPKFFLGTDSAPHSTAAKESSCGCAGSYTAYASMELYAMAFEMMDALDMLEGFASHFGPDFYNLPRNEKTITLVRDDWTVPQKFAFGSETLTPLLAGETIGWRLAT